MIDDKLSKVRAEIGRLRKEVKDNIAELGNSESERIGLFNDLEIYDKILSIIDSMQEEPVSEQNLSNVERIRKNWKEEPVSEDLEEACEQLSEDARKHKAETSSPFFSQTDYKQGVIDGAKWQKEKIINKACKWLEYNKEFVETEAHGIAGWIPDQFINDFRKAIEEE